MGEILIPVVAIVVPFAFAAWVIKMGVRSKERKRDERNEQMMGDRELEREILDLAKRIENLEIILRSRYNDKKE
jgi:hypothetical protein